MTNPYWQKLKAWLMGTRNKTSTSQAVKDQAVIAAFNANPENPYLVSFPRTGSHWFRMLAELYFEQPSLVRTFYFHNRDDFLMLHTHDMDLATQRRNVIYLYRDPVPTVFSQLQYENDDPNDVNRIRHWANLYGQHLDKWLYQETFTTRKTPITYEMLKEDMVGVFEKACAHFERPLRPERIHEVAQIVTREEVKRKTTHDDNVVALRKDYPYERASFTQQHAQTVWQAVLEGRPHLKDAFTHLSFEQPK